jgi:RsiW-degrading membrane proteinase PrsW (M82 family)
MMKFLKGLLIGLLSLILFGTVSALGFAFMLNQTFMDPNFIAGEVDKMDIAAIARSFPLPL